MFGLGIGIYSGGNIPTYSLFEPSFDATYYLENSSPTELPTNGVMSMFGWIKVPQPTTPQVLFGYGTTSDEYHQAEFIYNDSYRQIEFWWDQAFSLLTYYGDSNCILSTDTWYFIGMTCNGDGYINLHIYVNGRATHQSVGNYLNTEDSIIRVGLGMNHFATYANIFKGNVEKVGIWDRALSIDEINDYYNVGRVLYADLPDELTTISETFTANSQARFVNLCNLEARGIIVQDLVTGNSTYNQAASFSGDNQIWMIGSAPTNVVSISVWVNYGPESSNGPIIVKGNNEWNSIHWDWGIWADNNNFYACVQSSDTFCTIPHSNNTWYHIVLVRDNGMGNGEIYVNGTLTDNTSASSSNDYDDNMYIGGAGEQNMYGAVEEIELFDNALSHIEVLMLYNSGNGKYSIADVHTVAGYHLNGDTNNFKGNAAINGVWGGTAAYTTGGVVSAGYECAYFVGFNQIVISSAPTNVNSISLWVNFSGSSSFSPIIAKGDNVWASTSWDWGIFADTNNFYAVAQSASDPFCTIAHNNDTWYHLVLVRDDGSGSTDIYVNGSLVASGSASDSNDYDDNIYIGGVDSTYMKGQIQEVQLYDVALTSDDVTNLYNSGLGVYGSPTISNLIGGYHFNGDTTDYSANANNGAWIPGADYITGIISDGSEIKDILTSSGYNLDVLTQTFLSDIESSAGYTLVASKPYLAYIITSTGANLEFGRVVTTNSGVKSFWNLSESSGTRYDSVGTNHLNQIDVHAAFSCSSTEVVLGTSIVFTDESVLADSWLWNFGDEAGTSTSQNPTYTYESAGTYTVTLTINGGGFEVFTATTNVVIDTPSSDFTDDSPVYQGFTMTFTDTSTGANSWYWDFGDGGTSTDQNPTHTYSSAGTYTVTLIINA